MSEHERATSLDKLANLVDEFDRALELTTCSKDIEPIKVNFLGRKSPLQAILNSLGGLDPLDRRLVGGHANRLKEEWKGRCEARLAWFATRELEEAYEREAIDVTLPGNRRWLGHLHPLSLLIKRLTSICEREGFVVRLGSEIDSDYYNYEGLNFTKDHPARDMQDTFYLDGGQLLRSHTSNVQLKIMESGMMPIRALSIGRVYRKESVSARAHVMFHQVEAIYIDKKVTLGQLLSNLSRVLQELFQKKLEIRYRFSSFPFVEPGLEVDIACLSCNSAGCRLCKHSGWVEVAGAGMVHPNVLRNGGIDPQMHSGFAWGLGIERVAMLIYGVSDIRQFLENDVRWLAQSPSC